MKHMGSQVIRHEAFINDYVSPVRPCLNRDNADRRLSVSLPLQGLRAPDEAEEGQLLRLLLLWRRALPFDAGRAGPVARRVSVVARGTQQVDAASDANGV